MTSSTFSPVVSADRSFLDALAAITPAEREAFDVMVRAALERHEAYSPNEMPPNARPVVSFDAAELEHRWADVIVREDLLPQTLVLHLAQAGLVSADDFGGCRIPFAVFDRASVGMHLRDQLEFDFAQESLAVRKAGNAPTGGRVGPGAAAETYLEHFEQHALRDAIERLPEAPERDQIRELLARTADSWGAATLAAEHASYLRRALAELVLPQGDGRLAASCHVVLKHLAQRLEARAG